MNEKILRLTHYHHSSSSLTSGVLLVFKLCIAVVVLGLHPRHLGARLQLLVVAGEGSSLVFDHRGRGHFLGCYFTSEMLNFQIFGPGH